MISALHRPATGPAYNILGAGVLIAKYVKVGGNRPRFDAMQKASKN